MISLAPLRLARQTWRLGCRYSSSKTFEPLRILFCGSDEFSIASLRAVHKEHVRSPETIASINVVCRPGKRTGRGLKNVREVPIKSVAQELQLPIHEIDTFTGWQPPTPANRPVNLIVAVSFGLLVPPRILNGAKYGGLNVHPSMLPDLRGPAPVHHALLQGRSKTGISLQTLHPQHFDRGMILAQTPFPGLDIPDNGACTPQQLIDFLAPLGGQMLVEALRNGVFVPPLEEVGWSGPEHIEKDISHAPKITKEDGHIKWKTWTAWDILRRSRVLGDLWGVLASETLQHHPKRIIFHELKEIEVPNIPQLDQAAYRPGRLFASSLAESNSTQLFALTCDKPAKMLQVGSCTLEGGRKGAGVREILQNLSKNNAEALQPTPFTVRE